MDVVEKSEAAVLIERSAEANAALMRGDVDRYRALVPTSGDFTLMSPFGGAPSHGAQLTDERWEAMRRFFRNGTLRQELVQSYATADMIVLATIERAHVELVHRHADPLAGGVSVEQAAALARGEVPD